MCPAAIQDLAGQLGNDLLGISQRRSGTPDRFSQCSGLRNAESLAELDRMLHSLESGEHCPFQDSMEAEAQTMPSRVTAHANAAMSDALLGNDPDPVARFVLLEFSRNPQPFHAALLESPELEECRQLLQHKRLELQLAGGAKLFVRPEMYQYALDIATSRDLQPRHVLLEAELEGAVMAALTSLPSKLQVRVKNKNENVWVFAPKSLSAGISHNLSLRPTAGRVAGVQEEVTWHVTRTFIEVPLDSSLCSSMCSRQTKTV